MAAAVSKRAEDSAASPSGGELEQALAEAARSDAAYHQAESERVTACEEKEELEENLEEILTQYNELRDQKTLELQALEEELQGLGLTLTLPPPEPPKKGSWMASKVSKQPYHVLLSGQFKINLR